MVKRLMPLIVLLLIAGFCAAADKPYYQFPDILLSYITDSDRMLIYDQETGSSKNVTVGEFKSVFRGYSGPSGSRGYDGYDGATGPQGFRGYSGALGPRGFRGYSGSRGTPGSQLFTGVGAPSNGNGANSDFYVNTSNGDYYQKLAGAWSLKGNLTGPTGPPGPAATVDQPAVLSALLTPGGNPTTRQPLSPQTNSTVLWRLKDLTGNDRVWATGDGSLNVQDTNGYVRIKINPTTMALEMRDAANKLRWQKTSDGYLRQYRGDGTTLAFQVMSSGRLQL